MLLKWWTQGKLTGSRRRRAGVRSRAQWQRFPLQVESLEERWLLSAGAPDPSFGQNGVATIPSDGAVRAIAAQGDGKLIVLDQLAAGYEVLRLNTDGSLDTTFGDNGKVTATFGVNTAVVDLAVLPDGHIIVGGGHGASQTGPIIGGPPVSSTSTPSYLDVARFNGDGTVDGTFGNTGVAELAYGATADSPSNITAADMAVTEDGRVVMDGTSSTSVVLVRLTSAGSLDLGFGSAGVVTAALTDPGQAGGVALQGDGSVLLSAYSDGKLTLLRYHGDGTPDASFGAGGASTASLPDGATFVASRVAVAATDGRIVVSADSFTAYCSGAYTWLFGTSYLTLLRFTSNGQPDATFGTGGQVNVSQANGWGPIQNQAPHTLALQSDGKILVGGSAYYGSSEVTRYNVDGSLDLTFGNGGTAMASSGWSPADGTPWPALALQGDGKVVLASNSANWNDLVATSNVIVTRFDADSDIRPTTFGSEDALRQYLIDQAVQQYSWYFGRHQNWYFLGPPIGLEGTSVALADVPATANVAPTHSNTNVQEQGVDEGDTVKTDGQYLYLLANNKLVIMKAWPATDLATLSTTALDGNAQVEYLDGDRLTVISQDYQQESPPSDGSALPVGYYAWSHPVVDVTVYDVSDRSAPVVVQQTKLDGYYNNSRAIGDTVYVALQNYNFSLPIPQALPDGAGGYVYETEAAYRARMEALPLDSLLPHYTTSWTDAGGSHVTAGVLTAAADIYQPALAGDTNLLSLVSIDVAGPPAGPTHSVSFLTSYGATLYAAADNFYLITNRWSYVNNWTFIDKLSLQDGDITLTATGRVPGTIVNQFAVGEDGAYLHIATTSGWEHNTSNNLYVLAQTDSELNVVGKLEGMAPGESIYSVRFLGDRAFVSTYLSRDPLFAVDLSDPTAPRLAGQLDISGYTSYLQAIDATHLIGIGRDTDPVTGWVTDEVVSLFDVSDLSNPVLVSRYRVTADGWSWSQADYDYHAITYYPEFQSLAFPVTSQQWLSTTSGTAGLVPLDFGGQFVTQSDELVFHLDVATGALELTGEISDSTPIQRGVYIGDMFYSISANSVQVHALEHLSTLVAQAPLPAPDPSVGGWLWGGPIRVLPIEVLGVLGAPVALQKSSDLKSSGSTSQDATGTAVGPFVPPFIGPVAQNGSAGKSTAEDSRTPALVPGPGSGKSAGGISLQYDVPFFSGSPLTNQPGIITSGTSGTLTARASISAQPASDTLTAAFARQPLDLLASPVEHEQNTGPLLFFSGSLPAISGPDADLDGLVPSFVDPVELMTPHETRQLAECLAGASLRSGSNAEAFWQADNLDLALDELVD